MTPLVTQPMTQRGISLVESLVALLVLVIGVLSVLGIQLRSSIDNQSSIYRAQASRLVENLSERLHANPNAFAHVGLYVKAFSNLPGPSVDCEKTACNQSQLAQFDLNRWARLVQSSLPLGDAAVFVSEGEPEINRRQLGVLLAWRYNERALETETMAQKRAYSAPALTLPNLPRGLRCPNGKVCHLQYIPLVQRCTHPDWSAPDQVFCKAPA